MMPFGRMSNRAVSDVASLPSWKSKDAIFGGRWIGLTDPFPVPISVPPNSC